MADRLWTALTAEESPSAFKDGSALWVNGTEIAHRDDERVIDVRLTRAVIRARRVELRADPRVRLRRSLSALAQTMLLTDQPELHRAEPKTLRYRLLHTAARITADNARCSCAWPSIGPGPSRSPERSGNYGSSRSRPDTQRPHPPHHHPKTTETPDGAPADHYAPTTSKDQPSLVIMLPASS